jgi:hypothetical protein
MLIDVGLCGCPHCDGAKGKNGKQHCRRSSEFYQAHRILQMYCREFQNILHASPAGCFFCPERKPMHAKPELRRSRSQAQSLAQ